MTTAPLEEGTIVGNAFPSGDSSERELVETIIADWDKPNFGAVPYIEAMNDQLARGLSIFTDPYIYDPAGSIVLYFLANAQTWRGPVAKAVKAELKRRLK